MALEATSNPTKGTSDHTKGTSSNSLNGQFLYVKPDTGIGHTTRDEHMYDEAMICSDAGCRPGNKDDDAETSSNKCPRDWEGENEHMVLVREVTGGAFYDHQRAVIIVGGRNAGRCYSIELYGGFQYDDAVPGRPVGIRGRRHCIVRGRSV